MASPRYLLDTNILVQYVRGDALWESIRDQYQPLLIEPKPIISIVNEAETRSLSLLFHWGTAKLDRMEFLIGYLERIPIDTRDLIDVYSMIDSQTQQTGRKMGKNDLWIAATAIVHDATLLTTDADFDRLHPRFLAVERIAPA